MTRDVELYAEVIAKKLLQDLDPSLFQNIILGILAIFIPFGIVFLTNLLDSKKQRSDFEKMVLSEEVLGTKTIFWLSVFGIAILTFFSGKDISNTRKLIAITILSILILLFWRPFRKILRFSEGYKWEFEIGFLKKLRLSSFFRFRNKLIMDRMIKAWSSFWSERASFNEREFTKIFVKHIDEAISRKKYGLAVQLAQAYENNIGKRDMFSVGFEILPKTLEWHEELWKMEQKWIKREEFKDRMQNSFSFKHFPTFKKWVFNILNRNIKDDCFWNWHYFQRGLFLATAKATLHDSHGSYQLFTSFKKYIDDSEVRLEKIENENMRERWFSYIVGLFGSFCPMFFEVIDGNPDKYSIWHHYFPGEWKITSANSKKRVSRIILHEFLEWARPRILNEDKAYDKNLTEVISGVFPSAHPVFLPAFINLLFYSDVKSAIQKKINFSLITGGTSWSGEKSGEDIQKMFEQQDQSRTEETINIIFRYFGDWRLLKVYKDNISEEELSNWNKYSEEKRKGIVYGVRKSKLESVLSDLNGTEVVNLCQESERHEYQRKIFIELIELLLKNLDS